MKPLAQLIFLLFVVAIVGMACTCCGCVEEPVVRAATQEAPVHVTTTQPVDIAQELSAIRAEVKASVVASAEIKAKVTGIETHTANSNSCDYWDMRMRTIGVAVFALVAIGYAANTVPKWAQRLIASNRQ